MGSYEECLRREEQRGKKMMEIRRARRAWTEALVEGGFVQAESALRKVGHDLDPAHDGDTYCCLGVACEVYQQEKGRPLDVTMDDEGECYLYDGYEADLPPDVREWLGLSHRETSMLINLNDTEGFSFEQIAAVVRALPVLVAPPSEEKSEEAR